MHDLPALLGVLGLICLGLSLWLQRGCARGRFPPGRRRFCAAARTGLHGPVASLHVELNSCYFFMFPPDCRRNWIDRTGENMYNNLVSRSKSA